MRRLRAYAARPHAKQLLVANVYISATESWELGMYTRTFDCGSFIYAAHSKKLYATSAGFAYPKRRYVFNNSFIRASMPGYTAIYENGNVRYIK